MFHQVRGLLRVKKTKPEVIASFVPFVERKVILINERDGTQDEYFEGVLIFNNTVAKPPKPFLIPILKEVRERDWYQLSDGCILNPDCKLAEKYLMEILRYGILDVPVTIKYRISNLGWHEIDGEHYYYDGVRLIGADERNDIVVEPFIYKGKEYHLSIDTYRYNEREAVEWLWKAIELNFDTGLIVVLYTILSILKSFLRNIGIIFEFLLYVHGQSGIKKSTVIPLLSQLNNRDAGIKPTARLNSTTYSMEMLLSVFPDSVVSLDDLFSSDPDNHKFDKSDVKLREIIRQIGDDTGKLRRGLELEVRSGVIAMGECPLPANASTHARCLDVPFDCPINTVLLTECQNEQLAISTFYFYFIRWCTNNQSAIKSKAKTDFEDFRKTNILNVHPKLKDVLNIFKLSYSLLIEYICGVYRTSDIHFDNNGIASLTLRFEMLLRKLILEQNEKIEDSKPVDYVELIRRLYRNGELDISAKQHRFGSHACAISKDYYLCIRTEQLTAIIQKHVPTATHEKIMMKLRSKGVLKFETVNDVKKYTPKSCKERIRAVNIRLDVL